MFGIPTHLLAKVTVTETTTAVTLSVNPIVIAALSFTPRHLVVRTDSKSAGAEQDIYIQFNGDGGSNYNYQRILGKAATTSAERITGAVRQKFSSSPVSTDANQFASGEMLIPDALSTRSHKSTISFTGLVEDRVYAYAGRWADTAAITSVTLTQNTLAFAAGSIFELCVVDESYVIDEEINTSTAQFDHSSISAADGDLVVIGNLRSDVSSHIEELGLQFNNDSTDGNYARQRMTGHNNSVKGAYASASNAVSHAAGANADANGFSGFVAQIVNFSDGANDRSAITLGGGHMSDSDQQLAIMSLRRNNTEAIDRIGVVARNGSGWLANSMLSIYAVPKGQITRTELGSDTSSVTFSSIPATYDHLEVTVYARTDRSAVNDVVNMTFNTDTTASNYDHQELQGAGTTVSANTDAANFRIGVYASSSEGANEFGIGTTTIYNYTKTDRHKHRLTVMGSSERVLLYSRRWEDTSAINQIVLTPNVGDNFLAGSVFELRGINSTVAAAATDIETINGITPANIQAVN